MKKPKRVSIELLADQYPNLLTDFYNVFVEWSDRAVQDQIVTNQYSQKLSTYRKYIPEYFPYVDVNNEEHVDSIANRFSFLFYNYTHFWEEYKSQLPLIITSSRIRNRKSLPSYLKRVKKVENTPAVAAPSITEFMVEDKPKNIVSLSNVPIFLHFDKPVKIQYVEDGIVIS